MAFSAKHTHFEKKRVFAANLYFLRENLRKHAYSDRKTHLRGPGDPGAAPPAQGAPREAAERGGGGAVARPARARREPEEGSRF